MAPTHIFRSNFARLSDSGPLFGAGCPASEGNRFGSFNSQVRFFRQVLDGPIKLFEQAIDSLHNTRIDNGWASLLVFFRSLKPSLRPRFSEDHTRASSRCRAPPYLTHVLRRPPSTYATYLPASRVRGVAPWCRCSRAPDTRDLGSQLSIRHQNTASSRTVCARRWDRAHGL